MGTISPGTFSDNGVLVPIKGGPWTIGEPPAVRVAQTKVYSIMTHVSWNGTEWVVVPSS